MTAALPAPATLATRRPRHLAWLLLCLFVVAALLAPWLAPQDPGLQTGDRLLAPGAGHWLGTDQLGRDQLSRVLYSLRTDLSLIALVTSAPMVLGSAVGAAAGYLGGVADAAFRWVADIFQALPAYLLLLVLIFAMGPGIPSVVTAFAVMGWVTYARLIRAEVRRTREREYVQASYLSGVPMRTVLFRNVIPNSLTQTLVFFATDLAMALQAIAVLSYFGLGVPPGTPELGAMVADGQVLMRSAWWLSTVPGLVIIVLGSTLTVVADGLRSVREVR